METKSKPLNILVAPLDWGLGHTTRCIPVIECLLENGANVILAGNGIQQAILTAEFPQCRFLPLAGYNVTYSKKAAGFAGAIAKQIPAIATAVKAEQHWLQQTVDNEKIDGIISDNRFGLYSKKVPAAFITHQLLIKNGLGKTAERLMQHFNYRQIEKFDYCWVPDFEGIQNLGGELSHPAKMPKISLRYVNPLTRMIPKPVQKIKNRLLVTLSGPEPQRTLFEELLLPQLNAYKHEVVLVRGLPASTLPIKANANIKIFNHLNKEALNEELVKADYVICRSGYSSVMDINAVRAKTIMVPTPGQTEQEYLAKYLYEMGFAVTATQKNFLLSTLLHHAQNFNYSGFIQAGHPLPNVAVKAFLHECRKRRA